MFNIWGLFLWGWLLWMICFIRHILKLHVLFVGIDVLLYLLYLFFTFTTYYYLGYPCLLVYAVWSFNRIKHASGINSVVEIVGRR